MISSASTDLLLNKAFNLACFILGDRKAALLVVVGALAKLEVAVAVQGKRLYYRPTGRPWLPRRSQPNPIRNNISFNEQHLFQRLIYIESEPYEVAQEKGKGSKPAGEEELVIHFVKHLTTKTIKRNSFYVTLGLSRLLYSYTTPEAMDIYNAVIQDPERVKDDYYYRSRKGVLMRELKERFGDLINICRGPHGEERFQADDNQSRFVKLVRDCLSLFTPWQTPCLVPTDVDPIRDGIPSLCYQGDKKENQVEVNRMHAVVHPDCFQRLIVDLHFDSPDSRLEVPRFFYANQMNDNGSGHNRRQPPKLDEEELMSIKGEMDKYAARRKAAHASLLRIIVDGTEHARIDLKETGSARFSLDKDAELIEVRSRDNAGEELLLASHLFASLEPENPVSEADASIVLEGGQKILIHTSAASDETSRIVEIIYRETRLLRAASVFFQQMAQSIGSASPRGIWNDRRIFGTALAFIVLAICFGVILRYAWSRDGIDRNTATSQQNSVLNEKESLANQKAPKDSGTTTTSEKKVQSPSNSAPQQFTGAVPRRRVSSSGGSEKTARSSAQEKPDANAPETIVERQDSTRSVAALPVAVPLTAVKKVYLETSGNERFAQKLREIFRGRLRGNNDRISMARDRDEADALLKVRVFKSYGINSERANVLAELRGTRGDVIWPNAKSGGKYQGDPAAVSASIIRDLLIAIQESGHKR